MLCRHCGESPCICFGLETCPRCNNDKSRCKCESLDILEQTTMIGIKDGGHDATALNYLSLHLAVSTNEIVHI